ncbi:MAG: TRAP transporter substrate-binding protein [Alphaproteobacteria bacterium]
MENKRQLKKANTVARTSAVPSRRKFMFGAAAATAAGAATLAFPNVSRAQTMTLKFQSTWPAKDIFHEFAQDYVKRVNDMSGGRLKLDLLTAGAVVPAFQLQDAVNTGALDGGHGVTAYWYGKNKAFSLFGTGPAMGIDANKFLGWFYYGGGMEFYNELVQGTLKLNVVGFLTGPMPTQPLGWFKKEIKSPDDFKGLKYRTVGLSADLFKEMGAAVTILPGGEIVPAMERGVLDAAEFNNPSSDRGLGFPDVSKVYMLRSFHQPAECFEIIFNKGKYDALPADLKAVIKYASEAASADMSWKAQDRYSKDFDEMQAKQGVKAYETPKSVLEVQLKAWDKLAAQLSSADPFFAKIVASQKAWAKRVEGFYRKNEVNNDLAYEHLFGKS